MTLKEAKKILKKEMVISFHSTKPFVFNESCWIEHEKPSVLEAFRVLAKGGYYISISGPDYNMREKCLKKEYEQNTKAPGSGEEQPEEKKGIIYPSTSPKDDFYYKHVLNEGNPALEEAASQFNDALLDEQSKKIKRLTEKIARLNKIIHKKNLKIEEFRKESSRHLRGKIKMFGENMDLSQELCDKNEELRLTKIREKNLVELGLKYVGENEKLKKKLADKIVNEIDARALKSAESALAYKEKVIAEKDEVIADLGKELKAQKDLVDAISLKYDGAKHNLKLRMDECEKLKEKLDEVNNRIKAIRNASKGYCDYGIAAEKMIQKMAKVIVEERAIDSEDFEKYRLWANGHRFNPQIPDFSEEEEKKLSLFRDDSVGAVTNQKDCSSAKDTHPTEDNPEEVELGEILECVRKALEKGHTVSINYDKAEEGGDQSATIVQCDNGIILSKEEAEIIERCTKNGTELHYSEKDGLTYTNVFGEEMPIRCLRGMFYVFTDEEIENMKK